MHRPRARLRVISFPSSISYREHTDVAQENDNPESRVEKQALRPTRTILLVDDTHQLRLMTKLFLANFGFIVHSFSSAEDALAYFDSRVHDLIITDNAMPGMTGEEMAHIIKMRSPCTPVIMYSGSRPANSACLDFFVEKSSSLAALKSAVDKLLVGSDLTQ